MSKRIELQGICDRKNCQCHTGILCGMIEITLCTHICTKRCCSIVIRVSRHLKKKKCTLVDFFVVAFLCRPLPPLACVWRQPPLACVAPPPQTHATGPPTMKHMGNGVVLIIAIHAMHREMIGTMYILLGTWREFHIRLIASEGVRDAKLNKKRHANEIHKTNNIPCKINAHISACQRARTT